MNEFLSLTLTNLTSPVLLFFMLGVVAAWLRSDLEFPPAMGKALSIYLMLSIGFRGGVELSHTTEWGAQQLGVAAVAIAFSLLVPWLAYALLRSTTKLDKENSAAVAATYGSVSVVTFATAGAFLARLHEDYSGFFVAVLVLMESPAIVSGLVLARRGSATRPAGAPFVSRSIVREALVSGSVLILMGALAIGWYSGQRGMDALGGVLITPFQGILAIFLLEMGLIVVQRLRGSSVRDWRLFAFGIYMPLLGAALGLIAAWALGLSVGDGMMLTVLVASASYIAVPAALRHALPQADAGVYVTLSLAITFPFNIVIGIPLYHRLATWVLA